VTFTLFLNEQSEILKQLLELYFPSCRKVRVIDLTYGKGALWARIRDDKKLRSKYRVTKCDATPTAPGVKKRNLLTDDYSSLGLHHVAVFDPPYLIKRSAFDYQETSHNSWSADHNPGKYTKNQNVDTFNERVKCLAEKAPTFLQRDGLLLVKVMDPRWKSKLITHHITISKILHDSFELVDLGVYVRMGASTWTIQGHLHNLHGYWMAFRLLKGWKR
jgi:hypothetical protein